ncbi:uncharacterized protein TRIVIDRAFT_67875 [Trichoderma virens Gv29-8]|uniref:Uncharacterized protein n=1 Tax=Hypocrea virens (strain Gv29-8 / FGSC 10586) TaxID=413071 RepID=G9N122_HYPVG|nr:uncharacterized protein TRIVIDRAFT_67875 [Trichoderma virens Gv29-8]EHK19455.1 hypothetical protein TRIVIDRAFT_67875 [Trichoderma virens Gv29-8]UKZ58287.1 hypothetical protein TrVGV298_012155 [Trichoderma virens]
MTATPYESVRLPQNRAGPASIACLHQALKSLSPITSQSSSASRILVTFFPPLNPYFSYHLLAPDWGGAPHMRVQGEQERVSSFSRNGPQTGRKAISQRTAQQSEIDKGFGLLVTDGITQSINDKDGRLETPLRF